MNIQLLIGFAVVCTALAVILLITIYSPVR